MFLPYPLFLTNIFDYFEVDFFGKDVRMTQTIDVITEATLGHHEFVKVQSVWTNTSCFSNANAEDFEEIPAPAADPSETFPLLGIESPSLSKFSDQESFQFLEAICVSLVAGQTTMVERQALMDTQLQQQAEQLSTSADLGDSESFYTATSVVWLPHVHVVDFDFSLRGIFLTLLIYFCSF